MGHPKGKEHFKMPKIPVSRSTVPPFKTAIQEPVITAIYRYWGDHFNSYMSVNQVIVGLD